jgi:tetratricopeptide (TPR) repeat protein
MRHPRVDNLNQTRMLDSEVHNMEPSPLQQAVSLFDSGETEEALRRIRALAESASDPQERVFALCSEAACLLSLRRLQEARQRWREAIEAYPKGYDLIPDLVHLDAELCLHEKKPKEALDKFDCLLTKHVEVLKAPTLRELYAAVLAGRGTALAHLGQFEEASQPLEQALTLPLAAQLRPGAHYTLGLCYFHKGDIERAKESFLTALATNTQVESQTWEHYYLGAIYFRERAYTKTLQEFEWCERHADQSFSTSHFYTLVANTLHALGRGAEAKRYEALAAAAKYPQ